MRTLSKLLQTLRPDLFQVIKTVHEQNKPGVLYGFVSEKGWRHKSVGTTIEHIIDPAKYEQLQRKAKTNLSAWQKSSKEFPQVVSVTAQDWGDVTLEATKTYGLPYTVLNMANASFPGGAVLEGGAAQEENVWHRSTCILSLLDEGVSFNRDSMSFEYNEGMTARISALEQMTDEELRDLRRLRGQNIPKAYIVFLNENVQICFRGPEDLYINEGNDKSGPLLLAASDTSFPMLADEDIFPFFEMRAAAPDLSDNQLNLLDKAVIKTYEEDLRRRIAAQLDTLILAKRPNAILGAWGCGAFKNSPDTVARIYREEIEQRASCFQHLIFPILSTDYRGNNVSIFKKYLDGVKLGDKANTLTAEVGGSNNVPGEANPNSFFSGSQNPSSSTIEEDAKNKPKNEMK
ncbi:MAG: DUF2263 domain-containing protein [Legionella sp.]|nr:MAG: DUF2263 domain-containing protein [Legionella sp.]